MSFNSEQLARFTESITRFADAFAQATDVLVDTFKRHPELFDPYHSYRLAGYPHGKSNRGWKKWRKANG